MKQINIDAASELYIFATNAVYTVMFIHTF